MRRVLFVVSLVLALFLGRVSDAQIWLWQPSLPASERNTPIGFSIGRYGYVGLGANGSPNLFNDLWRLEPISMSWTRMADFPGSPRWGAAAFTIGPNAYVGCGYDGTDPVQDFWRYTPATNTWTRMADFPGGPRYMGSAFSIGGLGYFTCGYGTSGATNDLWQYEPFTNTWTRKADLPAAARYLTVAFSANSMMFESGQVGIVATGLTDSNIYLSDAWAYYPSTNTWVQRPDVPGQGRYACIAYNLIPQTGCLGGGYERTSPTTAAGSNDFFLYQQSTGNWTSLPDLYSAPGSGGNNQAVTTAAAFAIQGKSYVVAGAEGQGGNGTKFVRELGWLDLEAKRTGLLVDLVGWVGPPGVVATFRIGLPSANGGPPTSSQLFGTVAFDAIGRARITRPIPQNLLPGFYYQRAVWVRVEAVFPNQGFRFSQWRRVP